MRAVGAALLLSSAATAAELKALHKPSAVPRDWQATSAAVDKAAKVDVHVGIKRSNTAALTDTLKKVSTPGQKHYLKHLSWEEAGAMVRPPQGRIDRVLGWLRDGGAQDVQLHPHGDSVTAKLTVSQLEQLTAGKFQRYRHSSGRELDRLTSGVFLDAELASHIDTFTGFHGFPLPQRAAAPKKLNSTAGDVVPSVINKVYGIPTVAKSGKANIQAIAQFQGQYVKDSDLADFCGKYEPSGKSCKIAKYIGKNDQQPGVESMLDTEYIMGLGQGTETWVYSYPNFDFCADLLTWGGDVTANSTFPYVVSVSYGSQKIDFCDSNTLTRLSEDIQKMGTMGVTVTISSGDDGSGHSTRQGDNTGKVSPSFPASIPYAVAVGSTYFVSGTSGEEQATTQFGSGGGFSYDYTVPDYQKTAVSGYLAKAGKPTGGLTYATNGRGTPDVSLLGESFNVIVNGQSEAVGGTSASAPSFGAMMSLLNEVCLKAGGKSLGFPLPLFYSNTGGFTDITKGTSAIGGNSDTGVWAAAAGWDACTGLGTPDFAKLMTIVQTNCAKAAQN
eukprot:TRINITY_DN41_c0_g1_i1.p2 TRINITY_DN41_c0_g1~~TRINITY_DN41_c0_g1_i1.p2  ORF type:complete len:577 (+),score=243.03 TRINITY_DN41_c0_g1_i1:61-1731(+)